MNYVTKSELFFCIGIPKGPDNIFLDRHKPAPGQFV